MKEKLPENLKSSIIDKIQSSLGWSIKNVEINNIGEDEFCVSIQHPHLDELYEINVTDLIWAFCSLSYIEECEVLSFLSSETLSETGNKDTTPVITFKLKRETEF